MSSAFPYIFIAVGVIALIFFIAAGVIIVKVIRSISRTANNVTNTVNNTINTLKQVSQVTTGTSNIAEGIQRASFEYATSPRTVSDLSSMYLPKIAKDFPEFNNTEMSERAKNVLTSYLFSVNTSDPSQLTEGNEDLKNKLTMAVKLNQDKGYEEHFERIKVHKSVLHDYTKKDGTCKVEYQLSCQYIHYITENGKNRTGRDDQITQARYAVTMIYCQDRDQVTSFGDMALGSRCPHCGGQIKNLGDKKCPYCDSDVEIINIYAWTFSDITETS